MVILFRVLVTLHGVLNPPYTGNSSEWWLLFIFNSVVESILIAWLGCFIVDEVSCAIAIAV